MKEFWFIFWLHNLGAFSQITHLSKKASEVLCATFKDYVLFVFTILNCLSLFRDGGSPVDEKEKKDKYV